MRRSIAPRCRRSVPIRRSRFPASQRHRLANGLDVRTVRARAACRSSRFALHGRRRLRRRSGRHATGWRRWWPTWWTRAPATLGAIEVSDALARIGARLRRRRRAPTPSVFTLTTLARFADRGATLLAGMLTRPSLREADFDRVRQLRLDRLRQLKDVPPAVAERAFLRLLYGAHPYGHTGDRQRERRWRALSLDDVAAFHARAVPARRARRWSSPAACRHEELLRRRPSARSAAGPEPGHGVAAPRRPASAPQPEPPRRASRSCPATARRSRSCASATWPRAADTPDYPRCS